MKYLITIFSLLVLGFSNAQNHSFTVLATKGENKISTKTTSNALKAGDKLKSTDKLHVSKDGYVGLLHKNGHTVEIRNENTILVSSLEQNNNYSASSSSKYADFLFNNKSKLKHNYNITAAVERQPTVNIVANQETSYIKEIPLNIYWKKPITNKKATIKASLSDLTPDENLFPINTNDTIAKINFSSTNASLLKFELTNVEENHKANTILTPIKRDDLEKILNEYNELILSIDTSKATDLLILVSFFDTYNLPQYTTSTLLNIIQIEPNIPQYKELLNSHVKHIK